jgi:hypothetical protein
MPLDTYPASAAQNVVGLFARMGIEQLALGTLCVIALVRYRSMIPLLYAMLVVHHLASRGVSYLKPLDLAATSGASGPALGIALLSVAGLALSLVGRGYADPVPSTR